MTEMQDTIAAALAEVTREVVDPGEPFGYGVDYSCISELDDRLTQVDGLTALAHSLLRQLTTDRGELPPDPDDPETAEWGIDLLAYLNRGSTRSSIRELEGVTRNELRKDDRVADVLVTLTTDYTTIDLKVRVTPADPTLQPFTLIGALTPDGPILRELSNGI